MLHGRDNELQLLQKLRSKRTASLIVVKGRRRIGKSTLIETFGRTCAHFIQFQGLAPRSGLTDADQLMNVAKQFRDQTGEPLPQYVDWNQFFTHIANTFSRGESVILLDEISWMGAYNPDFAGILKIAWDTQFKKNSRLILVLCGSVSSWIEKNILHDTDFVGRISLTLRLGELGLDACSRFWGSRATKVSFHEQLKYLIVTGGIPKYLEELDPKDSVDNNVKRLCFSNGGYLFEDFEKIFSDIFGRRSKTYREIVRQLVMQRLSPQELSAKIEVSQSGELTEYLRDLEQSGFIARDYSTKPDGTSSRLSRLRISDNYLRFYLKYIEPNVEKIKKGQFNFQQLDSLLQWSTICGLQFENLVLNRIPDVLAQLDLSSERILFAGSHTQFPTSRQKGCQIDLLILCRGNLYYVCEIKFQQTIHASVVQEVEEKIKTLKVPRRSSVRSVLIYSGDITQSVIDSDYFDKTLDVGTMLT